MLTDVATIRTYFSKLGLEPEIADIYLALHRHGPQHISALARNSKVERTRIYRLIEKLLSSNLIELETHARRGIIKAAPIGNLRVLINQKEQDLRSLEDELSLIEQVLANNSLSTPAFRVQIYRGTEGIRHLRWKALHATTELLGHAYHRFWPTADEAAEDRWDQEFTNRKLRGRFLIAEQSSTSKTSATPPQGLQLRTLPNSVFAITHSLEVYDDILAFYHQKDQELFGLEIQSQVQADTQRALLEQLWKQAKALS